MSVGSGHPHLGVSVPDGTFKPEADTPRDMEETSLADFGTERDEAATVARGPPITYAWEPGGVDCDACGRRVETVWSDAAGQVCPDCKEW